MQANQENLPLDKMPIELLTNMGFNLEDFANLRLINKEFSALVKNNVFWRAKFKQHFPHAYPKLSLKQDIDWYYEFSKTCLDEYSIEGGKLFYLVKEKRFEALQEVLEYYDLNLVDKNSVALSQWIAKTHYQPFLDFCYDLAEEAIKANYETAFGHDNHTGMKIGFLQVAAMLNQIKTIKHLVAELSQQNINLHSDSATLFNYAIYHEHLEAVQTLLELGFDPNLPYHLETNNFLINDMTPLHMAACLGLLGITKLILSQPGVNIDAINNWNVTPLLMAVMCDCKDVMDRYTEVVNILLEKGANIEINHKLGMSPLFMAKALGHSEIALAIIKKKLNNYITKTNPRADEDYETYSIFNHKFNLSFFGACSAKEKKEAALALKRVYIEGAEESLEAHQKALGGGKLGEIYDDLKSLTPVVDKTASISYK